MKWRVVARSSLANPGKPWKASSLAASNHRHAGRNTRKETRPLTKQLPGTHQTAFRSREHQDHCCDQVAVQIPLRRRQQRKHRRAAPGPAVHRPPLSIKGFSELIFKDSAAFISVAPARSSSTSLSSSVLTRKVKLSLTRKEERKREALLRRIRTRGSSCSLKIYGLGLI